jgi:alginate O-acetyltransferase complex protein AlgI
MLFNSREFIFLFLPLALLSFWTLRKSNSHKFISLWVIVLSLFFYGWWSLRDLLLILVSILFNFLICQAIATHQNSNAYRKLFLFIGVFTNLSALAYFKYRLMIKAILTQGFSSLLSDNFSGIDLPLAISFFTFQQIAYVVDTYRKHSLGNSIINYAASVTFFPHLIAGPLVNYRDLYSQFEKIAKLKFQTHTFTTGITLFIFGLSKKLIIADHLATFADHVFINPRAEIIAWGDAWIGALTYTFQLYFDFSGYSDMAVGLALLFGIKLPANFMSPYQSHNIIEFWRRWHITLSDFLKNYLYISLGGNRCGPIRRYFNLLLTMLIGGIWHGAGFNFVIWGLLHGVYLILNHILKSLKLFRIPKPIGILTTFFFVVIAWVFFRAKNVAQAKTLLFTMFNFADLNQIIKMNMLKENLTLVISELCLASFICFIMPNTLQLLEGESPILHAKETYEKFPTTLFPHLKWKYSIVSGIALGLMFTACIILLSKTVTFIYYQF